MNWNTGKGIPETEYTKNFSGICEALPGTQRPHNMQRNCNNWLISATGSCITVVEVRMIETFIEFIGLVALAAGLVFGGVCTLEYQLEIESQHQEGK